MVSEIFDPKEWKEVPGFNLTDVTYHRSVNQGTVRIAFDRADCRNAFRPQTVDELFRTLEHARQTSDVGCILLTGNGPSPKDGGWAFSSGGDQRIRGKDGYKYEGAEGAVDPARLGRLHILEVQRLIRFRPKVVIAVVPGWAVGGGHSLHVVCDMTLASQEHALFKQTDPDVASFDSGYGSALLARQCGQKRAREIFFLGKNYKDIEKANRNNKTAIFFGFQNCSPIEDDINLVEKVHELGCRFMQLTYNNQSLLATGCYEKIDSGVTNFGREVIKEMNKVGIVIDMSHSAEKSTLDAIEISEKPIAITHANPLFWHPAKRNKSDDLLKNLSDSGGLLGLSLYPHHLKNNTNCTLESFCEMVAKTAEIMNVKNIGIGSDLCLNQPDQVVEWMRNGTWTKSRNYGEGSKSKPGFPKQPDWFKDARGFVNLEKGLKKAGFSEIEINGILGNNWYNFYKNI